MTTLPGFRLRKSKTNTAKIRTDANIRHVEPIQKTNKNRNQQSFDNKYRTITTKQQTIAISRFSNSNAKKTPRPTQRKIMGDDPQKITYNLTMMAVAFTAEKGWEYPIRWIMYEHRMVRMPKSSNASSAR
jgi:hypothetical protein